MGCGSSRQENSHLGIDSEDSEETKYCEIRGKRCMCLPYNDATMVAAQTAAIIASLFSWVSLHTIFISLIGLIMSQLLWCCRQSKFAMYIFVLAVFFSSLASLVVGIYAIKVFRTKTWCDNLTLRSSTRQSDDRHFRRDNCNEVLFASVAFVSSALWAISTFYMCRFVASGRHAKWEEMHGSKADGDRLPPIVQLVEMGSDGGPTEPSPGEEGAGDS